MKLRLISAFGLLALVMMSPAAAKTTAPTLRASLNFVHDRMVSQGRVDYVANLHDTANDQSWSNTFTAEMTNVTVNAPACKISFHWKTTLDGEVKADIETSLPFKLMRKVSVVNREQEIRTQVASDHPTWVSTVSPPVWVVTMTGVDNDTRVVDFTNEDAAERVARAVDHIMDLCGAPKDQF
jgi:hypothetical protein